MKARPGDYEEDEREPASVGMSMKGRRGSNVSNPRGNAQLRVQQQADGVGGRKRMATANDMASAPATYSRAASLPTV